MKFNVEVELNNNGEPHLKSGMFSWIESPVKHSENILISKSAITGSMIKPEIFIVENGKAVKRALIIGDSNNDQVEVLDGLSGTESIIVTGQQNLNDGDEVTAVN